MNKKLDFAEWFKEVCFLSKKHYKQNAENLRKQFASLYQRDLQPSIAVKEMYSDLVRKVK